MLPSTERRQVRRHACRRPLSCQLIDPLDESVAPAGVRNISSNGVCVVIEPHLPPGRHIEVAIRRPAGGATLHRIAEVVHALQVPSFREMWLTGCLFYGEALSDEQLRLYR